MPSVPLPTADITGAVVLVPGLGMGGLEVVVLAGRLRRAGYPLAVFRHFPWRGSLHDKAAALHRFCAAQPHPVVHLVGHSMGGLITLTCLADAAPRNIGRVVLLGSPVNGSITAQRIASLPLGRLMLGPCMNAARRMRFHLPAGIEVGGVAGSARLGVGQLVGVPPPNDGVVRIDEAFHPAMRDTCAVDASHTGMLFSAEVAELVDRFLRAGSFTVKDAR